MSDEQWTDPIAVGEDTPHPIWFAKAAFQLGHDTLVRRREDGTHEVKLPVDHVDEITERAVWLAERDEQGLPVDPLPSGRFPDDAEEYGDQIPVVVVADAEHAEVYIDFARPIRALGISPAMARTIALKLNSVADLVDPDGSLGMQNPATVTIGHVRVPDSSVLKEGNVIVPALMDDLHTRMSEPDPGEQADMLEEELVAFKLIGICGADACNEAQYDSPGGPTCKWGHGGAETLKPCWACTYDEEDEDAEFCKCGCSIRDNAESCDCESWTGDPHIIKTLGGS
jgi:hypothetical protein